jgi:hypothetical protein
LILAIYQYRASGMVEQVANDFIEINRDATGSAAVTQSHEKEMSPTKSGAAIENDAKTSFKTLSSRPCKTAETRINTRSAGRCP